MMCKNVRKKIQSWTAASFTFKSQNYLETCGMSSSEHIQFNDAGLFLMKPNIVSQTFLQGHGEADY